MFAYDLLCPVCGTVMDSIHTSRVGGMGESLVGSDGRHFHGQDSPDCVKDPKWIRGWNRGEITEIPDKEVTRMFKVQKSDRDELQDKLNALESEGWTIHSVISTLDFVNTKIVMGISAPLPQNVEYDIIAQKVQHAGGS